MKTSLNLTMPFKGERDYIGGVDFVAEAQRLLCPDGVQLRDINLSCYRMLRQCRVAVKAGKEPLLAKEHNAVVQAIVGDEVHFVGFSPVMGDQTIERAQCFENEQLKWIKIKYRRAEITRPVGVEAPLLTVLVAAIKASSSKSFPTRTGKWIFAQCSLKSLPENWESAVVTTQDSEDVRFFQWSVEVDGQELGKIVFFNDVPNPP